VKRYEREHSFQGGHARLEERYDGGFEFLCLPGGGLAYRMPLPHDHDGDPWEWFAEQGHLEAVPWDTDTRSARDEIRALGYRLDLVEEKTPGSRWLALVFPMDEPTAVGRKVARAMLRREAAQAALHIVRREEGGERWPAVE